MANLPVIPDYELLRRIGAGSYGEVWLARSVTGQYRAIKIVRRDSFDHSRPFEREFAGIVKFEPLSRSHKGLIQILHVGHNPGGDTFYYVMELADDQREGQRVEPDRYTPRTLSSELAEHHRLPMEDSLLLGLALTDALIHLHEHGLVHRDIKPSNIIFVNGAPKLADIGLVTAADQTKSFVGTEGYVPPEGPGSAPADLYSLGKMLYEMSTGNNRHQFPALPTNLDGVLKLNEVILRACEDDVRYRYHSAREMHADLAQLQQGKALRRGPSLRRWGGRLRRIAVPTALLLGILASGWVIWHERHQQAAQVATELVTEGDKWLQLDRLDRATDSYLNARTQFIRNGNPPLVAELGLWEVYRRAPPALNTFTSPVAESVAFLPDGRRALTGGDDGNVYLWDVATGRLLRSFGGHSQKVWAVATDGRRALTGSDGHLLKLWDVETGRELRSWPAHDGQVLGIALLPGEKALSTGTDGLVKLWELDNGALLRTLTGHVGAVYNVSASADGRRAITGGADHTVKLWDVDTGALLRTFAGHREPVYAVALSANGSNAVSGGVDGTLRLWDTATGQELRRLTEGPETIESVAISADDQHVLAGGGDGTIRYWEIMTGQPTRTFLPQPSGVNWVGFAPNSTRALTASQDGSIKVWDLAPSLEVRQVQAHSGPVKCVAVSGDGRVGLSSGGDVKLWDITTMHLLQTRSELTNLTCAALNEDGRRAALGFADGAVKLWDIGSNQLLTVMTLSNRIRSVEFAADGLRALSPDRGNQNDERLMRTIDRQIPTATLVKVCPNPQRALVACADGTVRLWNIPANREERLYFGHTNSILTLAISPDGEWFASGSKDATVKLWSFARKDELRTLALADRTNAVTAIACRSGEPGVLSGNADGTLIFWDLARPRRYLQPKRGPLASRYEFRGCNDWADELRTEDSHK
jgi:WD40 repeat protein